MGDEIAEPEVAPQAGRIAPYRDGRSVARSQARRALSMPSDGLLVVVDAGQADRFPIDGAAAATPGWRWVVLSAPPANGSPLITYSWTDESTCWRTAADVVVTSDDSTAWVDTAHTTIMIADTVVTTPWARLDARTFANVTIQHRWPAPEAWSDLLADALAGDRETGLDRLLRGPRP